MKRTFITLMILTLGLPPCFSQISLADLIKGKVDTTKVVISESGTDGAPAMVGLNEGFIAKAVSAELSVIRQQYRLQQGKDYYGKNNKPFYGETYSLGIKVAGGMVFQNQVVMPWIGDEDYQRVNQTGKYKPVLFWSYQKALNDSVYNATELEIGTQYVKPIDNDSLLYLHTDSYSDFGLTIDDSAGEKNGFLIWAYSSTNTQDSAMAVRLKQSAYRTHTDSASVVMSPIDADKIIGGLYVVPKYDRGGRIQLILAGIASKNKNGKWQLQLMCKQAPKREDDLTPTSSGESEPTKIEKSDKKKKRK